MDKVSKKRQAEQHNHLILVRFVSDSFQYENGVMKIGNNKGFFIQYKALEPSSYCGGNYTHASGILSSPSHPNSYPQSANCIYLISQPNGAYVNISFIIMDIYCPDYIEMRDGNYEDSPLMGRFCGNGSNVPPFIQTTQNHMWIR